VFLHFSYIFDHDSKKMKENLMKSKKTIKQILLASTLVLVTLPNIITETNALPMFLSPTSSKQVKELYKQLKRNLAEEEKRLAMEKHSLEEEYKRAPKAKHFWQKSAKQKEIQTKIDALKTTHTKYADDLDEQLKREQKRYPGFFTKKLKKKKPVKQSPQDYGSGSGSGSTGSGSGSAGSGSTGSGSGSAGSGSTGSGSAGSGSGSAGSAGSGSAGSGSGSAGSAGSGSAGSGSGSYGSGY
jgi:hypothetical protein